jgi:hypothetical protein
MGPGLRSAGVFYAVACAPLVVLLAECGRGAYCDLEIIRTTALRQKLSDVRASATRRADDLVAAIQKHGGFDDWNKLEQQPWLKEWWER